MIRPVVVAGLIAAQGAVVAVLCVVGTVQGQEGDTVEHFKSLSAKEKLVPLANDAYHISIEPDGSLRILPKPAGKPTGTSLSVSRSSRSISRKRARARSLIT
jgi:hypothetical protein